MSLNPSVAIGSTSALVFALAMGALAFVPWSPEQPPALIDVTEYRTIGYECGPEKRTMLSKEESDFTMECKDIRVIDRG